MKTLTEVCNAGDEIGVSRAHLGSLCASAPRFSHNLAPFVARLRDESWVAASQRPVLRALRGPGAVGYGCRSRL
jgi:hypothetical protein